MAFITTNTTGTQPVIELKTATAGTLSVACLKDISISNSTGIHSYTVFCSTDTKKLTTPSDNSISTNMVIDDVIFFGNVSATAGSAANLGIQGLSATKTKVDFSVFWQGNTASTTDLVTSGSGYITKLAPSTSPDAPLWVTPMEIAVDGTMITGRTG